MTQLMQLVIGANDTLVIQVPSSRSLAQPQSLRQSVVQRDTVGRTLMKSLHAAAEMELLWPKHRPGVGRPPEDRVARGKPGKNTTLIGHQQPRGAQIAAERQQAIRFSRNAPSGEGRR